MIKSSPDCDCFYVIRINILGRMGLNVNKCSVQLQSLTYCVDSFCLSLPLFLWVKAHYRGAKIFVTLYYFLRVPCLNFNHVMSLLWRIFTMFLHIMVGQNPNKSNSKETTFFNLIWCDVKVYLCQKYICHNIFLNENIFKILLKWFLIFMKFVIFIKHCDSIWLE